MVHFYISKYTQKELIRTIITMAGVFVAIIAGVAFINESVTSSRIFSFNKKIKKEVSMFKKELGVQIQKAKDSLVESEQAKISLKESVEETAAAKNDAISELEKMMGHVKEKYQLLDIQIRSIIPIFEIISDETTLNKIKETHQIIKENLNKNRDPNDEVVETGKKEEKETADDLNDGVNFDTL